MTLHSILPICLLLGCLGSPAFAADPADTHPDLHLVPWPKSVKAGSGHMPLTEGSRIVAGDESLKPLADVLAADIATITGLKLKPAVGTARPGDIVLRLDAALRAGEPILMLKNREPVRTTDGAHAVSVGEQAVVTGFDYRAIAEGTATILQLLDKSEAGSRLPRVEIKDWPHADYCGVMLDVARQDHPIDAIKKVVNLCRLYKARYLQLHLTDDQGWTFPSTKFPKLGSKNYGAHGGVAPRVYKLEELKELVAYADARGVTLVPELEVPGHSGAALRSLPEIFDAINPQSKQPVGMGCMNMSNEAIYPALDAIIGEMCDVFRSSPYFHIGSDEVSMGRVALHPGYRDFMTKHNLKDDHQLADHFVASVCAMVKKHGKKAMKWEGLSNLATKDVIIMGWELNSTVTTDMLARGYTTITVPWTLAVPWEQWNMYVCNGSRHKKGDAVLGAVLVAWEQPWLFHVTSMRNLALRQERTWGPDNAVTVGGFAARFRPLDAVAGKLIGLPPQPRFEAAATTALGTRGFLDPVFAFDDSDETLYKSAASPKAGDAFTLTFPQARAVHAIETLTGVNGKGQLDGGEVQVSADGLRFTTVAKLDKGSASAAVKEHRVKAVRIRAATDSQEPLVIRAVNLQFRVEIAGRVSQPAKTVGVRNVAEITDDAEFAYPIGEVPFPTIVSDHTLKLNNGGNSFAITGPISGTGRIEVHAGNSTVTLDGKAANAFKGTWSIESGNVILAKEPGATALAGTIRVGGSGLTWTADHQIDDAAEMRVEGKATLTLTGKTESFAKLDLAPGASILAGGGVLSVRELTFGGKSLPAGIYTAGTGWIQGQGYVVVGDVKRVATAGEVEDPNRTLGADSLATLSAASTFKLPEGGCSTSAVLGGFPLTLTSASPNARFSGLLTGSGSLKIEGPLELVGANSNLFIGSTTLARGTLKLNKPKSAVAIPGNLTLTGGGLLWHADGQIAASGNVVVQGDEAVVLDLNGHAAVFSVLQLTKTASIRTGDGGTLRLKQLFIDGTRIKDGVYRAPQAWLTGGGSVTVDSRVDVQGVIGSPEAAIGSGNIGNLTGHLKIGYPSSGGDFDIATNGHPLTLDSGDGNAFAWSGSIAGTGNVEFFMGPSSTGYRDAPMLLTGKKPNTTTGTFFVRKGRVQLKKPEGVDAISGNVSVGGQGFNDCLFWNASHQIKDSATITLLDAGNNGAAYLHLNGCQDSVAALVMTKNNKILTDSGKGIGGVLTVKSLTINGVVQPVGEYTAADAKWIEGKGSVIVKP